MSDIDLCPVCGKAGVKACVSPEGAELPYDHEGRPKRILDWLAIVSPHPDADGVDR